MSLREMGVKDIGFGITVSNNNSEDMLSLYRLSKALNMEFATAAFHNSYYFHKDDNVITNRDTVCGNFAELINMQMREKHPKSWARAFFNMGLINYIEGNRRMLPCEAGLMTLMAKFILAMGWKLSIGKRAWETFDRRTLFRIFGAANKPNMCVVWYANVRRIVGWSARSLRL